jgi:RNAse (barnase) inhibitor barstar
MQRRRRKEEVDIINANKTRKITCSLVALFDRVEQNLKAKFQLRNHQST